MRGVGLLGLGLGLVCEMLLGFSFGLVLERVEEGEGEADLVKNEVI